MDETLWKKDLHKSFAKTLCPMQTLKPQKKPQKAPGTTATDCQVYLAQHQEMRWSNTFVHQDHHHHHHHHHHPHVWNYVHLWPGGFSNWNTKGGRSWPLKTSKTTGHLWPIFLSMKRIWGTEKLLVWSDLDFFTTHQKTTTSSSSSAFFSHFFQSQRTRSRSRRRVMFVSCVSIHPRPSGTNNDQSTAPRMGVEREKLHKRNRCYIDPGSPSRPNFAHW